MTYNNNDLLKFDNYNQLCGLIRGKENTISHIFNDRKYRNINGLFAEFIKEKVFTSNEISIIKDKLCVLTECNQHQFDQNFSSSKDDNKYVPPSIVYAGGWDMVASADLNAINSAFHSFYQKYLCDKDCIINYFHVEQIDVDIQLSFKLPEITLTGLTSENDDTLLSTNFYIDNVEVSDSVSNEKLFDIPSVNIDVKFVLQNIITETEYEESLQKLDIIVAFDEHTIHSAFIKTGTPPFTTVKAKLIWNGLIDIINQKLLPFIFNNLPFTRYTLLSLVINKDRYKKIEPFIPSYAKYNGAVFNDKSLFCMFSETISDITGKSVSINIDDKYNPSNRDNGIVALSSDIILPYIICPQMNKKLQEKGVPISFKSKTDNNGVFLVSTGEIKQKQDVKDITISNIQIRFIDNGVHICGDLKVVCAKISKFQGSFMMNGFLEKNPTKDGFTIRFNEPYLDINLSLNIIGRIIELILGLTGIGIIVDVLGEIIIATINVVLLFSPNIISDRISIPEIPICWNNLNVAHVSSIDISDGIRVSMILNVSDSNN